MPTATPSQRALALPAALFTVTLWASAFVGIRAAGRHFEPGALALGRLLVASVTLTAIALWRRGPLPPRRDLPRIACVGLLWFGVYMVLLNTAERHLDAGTAAILIGVGPAMIAVLAGMLLGEGFPRSLFVGCALAFAGVLLIGAGAGTSRGDTLGIALALLAAAAYAVAVVLQKPVLARASSLHVTWLACGVGTVACLPFAGELVDDARRAPASSIAWIVFLGLMPTAFAFLTWGYALARTSAGRTAATTYLAPPIAIVLAWAWLGETPTGLALVGGVVCLAGVVVARRPPPAARAASVDSPPDPTLTGACVQDSS